MLCFLKCIYVSALTVVEVLRAVVAVFASVAAILELLLKDWKSVNARTSSQKINEV